MTPFAAYRSAAADTAVAISVVGVDPLRCDRAGALLGLGECGEVLGEAHQSSGLIVEHCDVSGSRVFDPVLDGLDVGLEHRRRVS